MNFNSREDLNKYAKSLKGYTILKLLNGKPFDKGKGAIGQIIEREGFGMANNNEARPDFDNLGIELKVLPLKRTSKKELAVKERTKVCSINYIKLVDEVWDSSHAKNKLNEILFVFYEYDAKEPLNSIILDHTFFQLENNDEPLIRSDWERTRSLVEQGLAHELSESQNVVLAASRAGAGGLDESKWDIQPNKQFSERARKRAFSLKPSFTKVLWNEVRDPKGYDSIRSIEKFSTYNDLERIVLEKLNKWEGKTLAEFANYHGLESGSAKNSTATIVRAALGFTGKNKKIKEFEQLGLIIKTAQCRLSDFYPFEAMSFPFQPLAEIKDEKRFDESLFYTYLQGFLFVPLLKKDREVKNLNEIVFGRSVIWRPTHDDLVKIQAEWELINSIINTGIKLEKKPAKTRKGYIQVNDLPGEKDTQFIHMRPHGRNSDDIDDSIDKIKITKQCFWFNKKLIQRIVLGNSL
jgi:DNA mismatch repair protein MutH